ncbi:phenylacetate--CoA ligase family protein [Kaistella antarctica]|uniref:Polysaccharide biosynthesis protein n=1 Tax=Kaistella antarctica TaxID=266748 RepID=A0A3S4UMA9_9FLAO|nr:phenylacetate--CoA ligase family protein [Kaistella antarctica]KEY18789.1 polysaccharide biosynthesis protein [Kaistella antarctica]SEW15397.1 phenylacetate-CoA ligase [Kaistella antarctica]VEH99503.1 putative adenylate-forming enzyme [Kaistella antarctica]
MKDKIYAISPVFLQELLITIFNWLAYKKRYGGSYRKFRTIFKENRTLFLAQLKATQKERFSVFLKNAKTSSAFYKNYPDVDLSELHQLPILKKEDLRKNIADIFTVPKATGIVSKTGGTTGKSLEVLFTNDNMQERFAMLDDFRNRFGYQLGKKTAWFSGKNLLTDKDIRQNRFWKTDFLYKVRYYSTFHIKDAYLQSYVQDLIKFQPEYLVGFPSSILEIAKFGLKNKIVFPANTVKAIFPTAETLTEEMYEVIESFFKTKMYNQYASSEGAPFIIECSNGNLHLELQSGVFEVLDENNNPTRSGKLVLTSFTTEGTPLIRYDIGDSITLENESKTCSCGNHNPLVKEILGRIDDYIYSPENGKINLGNISNTLKDTEGIIKFQAIQDDLNQIVVKVMKDDKEFSEKVEKQLIQNWRDRIGDQMILDIQYVEDIPTEKSGKFRMVKNNVKHLISEEK